MDNVFRTGPFPEAADYSKNLLKCLQSDEFQIGSVSRVQQLLTCLVERLHDAIYVLPRSLDSPPDPNEYAQDLFDALKALQKFAKQLPNDSQDLERESGLLEELKLENEKMMQTLKIHLS